MINEASQKEFCDEISKELEAEQPKTLDEGAPRRARKATLLKLQWLAERLRKVERVRKQIEEGSYHVASEDVARSILNLK